MIYLIHLIYRDLSDLSDLSVRRLHCCSIMRSSDTKCVSHPPKQAGADVAYRRYRPFFRAELRF